MAFVLQFCLAATVSFNKISLLIVSVNTKNNSKTSNKQQKRKLIEEKCYWNQPYVSTPGQPSVFPVGSDTAALRSAPVRFIFRQSLSTAKTTVKQARNNKR